MYLSSQFEALSKIIALLEKLTVLNLYELNYIRYIM